MKHRDIHNDLIFYLEGELPKERQQEIREHLAGCRECREFLEVLRVSFSIIEKEKNPEVNPYFYQAIKAKIENRSVPEKKFSLQRILQPALFTALLITGIGFGVLIGSKMTENKPAETTANEMFYFNEIGSEPIESYFLN